MKNVQTTRAAADTIQMTSSDDQDQSFIQKKNTVKNTSRVPEPQGQILKSIDMTDHMSNQKSSVNSPR